MAQLIEFPEPERRHMYRWFCTKCGQLIATGDMCDYECEYDAIPVQERPSNRVSTALYVLKSVKPGIGEGEPAP